MQFQHEGHTVLLKGVQAPSVGVSQITVKQVYKSTKRNDIWAYVVVDTVTANQPSNIVTESQEDLKHLLVQYADVFQDPKQLPPHRSYDHAIPFHPDVVPINLRPYHYSPQHKTEIETQVKQLLESGLITHSHSPFASPVLLVKKKDDS